METIIIEVRNQKAIKLLEDLEALSLIRIVRNKIDGNDRKLSERLAGSVSADQAKKLNEELLNIRNEWNRDF